MNDLNPNASGNPPVTFTYHWYPKLAGAACMLLFGLCSAVSFLQMWDKEVDLFTAIVFPGFAFMGLVLFLWMSKRWTVRDDGIVVRSWYGREELHYWTDMDSIQGTGLGSGIKIKDQFGKTVLSLDPWIRNYEEFVELLRLHKKELFSRPSNEISARNLRVLKRNPILAPLGILFSMGFIILGVVVLLNGEIFAIVGILIGIFLLFGTLKMPSAVHLLEDSLRFEYLRGERTVPAEAIHNIYSRTARDYQGGAGASVIIALEGGKKIELAGFKDGTPMVANVLRNWLEEYWKSREALEESQEKEFLAGDEHAGPAGGAPV